MSRRKKKPECRILSGADWLSASEVEPMLKVVRMSPRKRRLFACACCRRLWHLLTEDGRRQLEAAEGMIDREVSREERDHGFAALMASLSSIAEKREGSQGVPAAVTAVLCAQVGFAGGASALALRAVREASLCVSEEAAEQKYQADLLREVVGNPFRPVPLAPSWFSPELVALATDLYRERQFGRVPELAPVLEAAGCDDPEILGHCRGAGEHVWGCWLLDLLLGKG